MSDPSASARSPSDDHGRVLGLIVLSLAAFVALSSTTGLLVSVYALMVLLLSVPLTLLMRRISVKRMLLDALLGYVVCNVLSAVAPTFGVLIAARCIGGAAHAIFFSACIGQAARLALPGGTARAFAIVSAGISAGYVLGSPLVTALGNAGGWRLPFGALVGLTVVTFILLAWLLPRSASARPPEKVPVSGLRGAVGVISANGLTYLGQYILYTYITLLLLHVGLGPALVPVALLVFGVAGLVGLWRTASLLDRRPRLTSVTVLIVVAASMVAIGLATSSLTGVLVFAAIWGVAYGPVATLFQSSAIRSGAIGPEMAGAWINTTSNLGIAAGALLGGIVLDHASLPALATGAALPIAAAAIVMAVVTRGRATPIR
jgi:predicted MFS family arabinose efflux permease